MIKEENGMYTHVEKNPHLEKVGIVTEFIDENTMRIDLECFTHHYIQVADSLACGMNRGKQFPQDSLNLLNNMCNRIVTLASLTMKVQKEATSLN